MILSFHKFRQPSILVKLILYFVIFITYFLISRGYWIANDIEYYTEWFYIVPLLFLCFTIVYNLLLVLGLSIKFDVYLKYDTYTYLFLPLLPVMLSLKVIIPAWFFWFGVYYLTVLIIKSYFLLRYLFDNIEFLVSSMDIKGKLSIILTILTIYIFTSLWVCNNYTTDGDEPHYLILTQSLINDHDFNTLNNYKDGDYLEFYPFPLHPQGFGSEDGTYIPSHNIGFPIMISPGYYFGKRAGVVFEINIITALLMLNIFLLIFEIFKKPKLALFTTFLVSFSPPILFYSSQIFPETTAALITVFAFRYLRKYYFGECTIKTVFFISLLSITILPLLKLRYSFIIIPLLLLLIVRNIKPERIRENIRILLSIILPIALVSTLVYFFREDIPTINILKIRLDEMFRMGIKDIVFLNGFLGLFIDKQFGLLTYSPIFLLSLLGLSTMFFNRKKEFLLAIFTAVPYFAAIAMIPWWHSGWCPPSRFLVILIPFFSIGIAQTLEKKPGLLLLVFTRFLIIITGMIAFILTLLPIFRYNNKTGSNHLLALAGRSAGCDIDKLFPSFFFTSPISFVWSIIFIATIFLFIIIPIKKRWDLDSSDLSNVDFLTSGLGNAITVMLLIFSFLFVLYFSETVPTFSKEFENIPLSIHDPPNLVYIYEGRQLLPEKPVEFFTINSKGENFITIYARSDNSPGPSPRLDISVNDKPLDYLIIDSQMWSAYYIKVMLDSRKNKWTLRYNTSGQDNIYKYTTTFRLSKRLYPESTPNLGYRSLEIDKMTFKSNSWLVRSKHRMLGKLSELFGNDLKALSNYAYLLNFTGRDEDIEDTIIRLCIKNNLWEFVTKFIEERETFAKIDSLKESEVIRIIEELVKKGKYEFACQLITDFGITNIHDEDFIKLASKSFITLGHTEIAKKLLSRIEKSDKSDAYIFYLNGLISLKNGDTDTAISYFRKSLNLKEPIIDAISELKKIYELSNQQDEINELDRLSFENMTSLIQSEDMYPTCGEVLETGGYRMIGNGYLQSSVRLTEGYVGVEVVMKGRGCFETPKAGFVSPFVYPNLEITLDETVIDRIRVLNENDWSNYYSIGKYKDKIYDLKLIFPNYYIYEKDKNSKYLDIKSVRFFKLGILFPHEMDRDKGQIIKDNWETAGGSLWKTIYFPGRANTLLMYAKKSSAETEGKLKLLIDENLFYETKLNDTGWSTYQNSGEVASGEHNIRVEYVPDSNNSGSITLAWLIIYY